MARIPGYRRHTSGQAGITLNGKDHLLGPRCQLCARRPVTVTRSGQLDYLRLCTRCALTVLPGALADGLLPKGVPPEAADVPGVVTRDLFDCIDIVGAGEGWIQTLREWPGRVAGHRDRGAVNVHPLRRVDAPRALQVPDALLVKVPELPPDREQRPRRPVRVPQPEPAREVEEGCVRRFGRAGVISRPMK